MLQAVVLLVRLDMHSWLVIIPVPLPVQARSLEHTQLIHVTTVMQVVLPVTMMV
jgi:hypothetical protein